MTFHYDPEHCRKCAVPWDPEQAVIFLSCPDIEGIRLAIPTLVPSDDKPFGNKKRRKVNKNKLLRYPVHARCWEILSRYKVYDIAKGDLPTLLEALRLRGRQC